MLAVGEGKSRGGWTGIRVMKGGLWLPRLRVGGPALASPSEPRVPLDKSLHSQKQRHVDSTEGREEHPEKKQQGSKAPKQLPAVGSAEATGVGDFLSPP